MDLFEKYSYNPFDINSENFLDQQVESSRYKKIYSEIKIGFSKINSEISKIYFKNDFNYLEKEFKLISTKRIVFNLFIKLLILQKIKKKHPKKKIIIKVCKQELDFYKKGYSGFSANRFANHYAWLVKKIGYPFIIVSSEGQLNKYVHETKTSNILLKIIDFKFSHILFEILDVLRPNNYKKSYFHFQSNDLIKEIKAELIIKNIWPLNIYNNLKKIYFNSIYKQNKIDTKKYEVLLEILSRNLLFLKKKYNLEDLFFNSYCSIIAEITTYYINHLHNVKSELRKEVKILKSKVDFPFCVSNGLFGGFGLSVCDALLYNNIKIFVAEHGVGFSKDLIESFDEDESKTSQILFTYNSFTKERNSLNQNNNLKTFVTGAPSNVKNLNFKKIQRLINRIRYKEIKFPIVYYVSHNIQLNSEKYFPHTKSNPEIFRDEIVLLNSLGKINKQVYIKSYPTKQYLHEKDEIIKKIVKNFENLNLVKTQEDFRYMRTLSDVIVTQSSESTLAWCIGLEIPLVFLDSDYYEPLTDEIKKVFQESFFFFNYDKPEWEKDFIDFLNQPYSTIVSLWNEKAHFRKKYDEKYFLSKKLNAGKLGRDKIIDFIKSI